MTYFFCKYFVELCVILRETLCYSYFTITQKTQRRHKNRKETYLKYRNTGVYALIFCMRKLSTL
jgi:hypothetical protein